jgi:hypothetical protein
MAIAELVITGMGVPPFSVRGVVQTLEPIDEAVDIRRTMNGTAINLSQESFLKYRSEISCEDMDTPAIDQLVVGMEVTVECVQELCYAGSLPLAGNNSRPAVTGSAREANGFVFYRPVLTMIVFDHSVEHDEWGAVTSWSLELEEV